MRFNLIRIKKLPANYYPSKKELAGSYQLFCEFLRHIDGFGHSPFPDYKHALLQQLDNMRFDESSSEVLIMEPRGHAKTTVDVIPYAPWLWLSEPHLRVGVYSAGERHSKKITRGIIRIVEKLAALGYYKIKDKKKQELTLCHDRPYLDPSLECYPIQGSSGVGSRKDVIIADDVYTTENANTETKAIDVVDRYDALTDLWTEHRFVKRITVGTRLHSGDLYDDILSGKWNHKVLWYPVIPESRAMGLPNRIENIKQAEEIRKLCIWPEILPAAKLMSAYNSPRRWNTQYMLMPVNNALPVFQKADILVSDSPVSPDSFEMEKLVIVIDPAVGAANKTKGDNCSMVVGGISKDGMWRVVDGWFSNTFLVEDLCAAWKQLMLRWQRRSNRGQVVFPLTVVEAQAQQALLFHPLRQAALDEPIRGQARFTAQTTGNIKKELRIEGFLSPIISRHKLVLHNSPIRQQLMTELLQFPGYRYRDVADAVAGLVKALARFDPRWLTILRGEHPEVFTKEEG